MYTRLVMQKLFHSHSPFRIFWFSVLATAAALIYAAFGLGASAFFVTLVLIAVEITFSFENAIINAKILAKMSKFWQNIFLSIGIIIAIFGMRVVFPILLVVITAGLGWGEVVSLALNNPEKYALELEHAHPQIAAFGGAFLLMLALHFFLDDNREILWLKRFEGLLQRYATFWMPAVLAIAIVLGVAFLPFNEHRTETLMAGGVGILTYTVLHALIRIFESFKERSDAKRGVTGKKVLQQTGMAAFASFMYLEVLDASFSLDGVVGAFAVTNDVVLIALGLGVGAIWVRSLTIFMVRRGTLHAYRYLEHGAHYTVFALAAVLMLGIFWHVPEVVAGSVGIVLITAAIISSVQANRHDGIAAK